MKNYEYILNGVLYQGTWFLCIFFPDEMYSWIAACVTLSVHLNFTSHKIKEFVIILIAGFMGYCMDQSMDLMGLLDTAAKSNHSTYLLIIWVVFACTLRSSFKFIFKTKLRPVALGLIAPLSYFFAQKIGVVKYSEPLYMGILIHMILYTSLMSLFYQVNKKLEFSHV
jgi:hypothetical protein